jgi:hypothetical protein
MFPRFADAAKTLNYHNFNLPFLISFIKDFNIFQFGKMPPTLLTMLDNCSIFILESLILDLYTITVNPEVGFGEVGEDWDEGNLSD